MLGVHKIWIGKFILYATFVSTEYYTLYILVHNNQVGFIYKQVLIKAINCDKINIYWLIN